MSAVSGVADVATGSVKMRATFDNPHQILRSGTTGKVSFPVNKSNAILVQQKSTVEIQNKKFVYLVDKNNKVHSTEIEVMPQNDGQNYIVTKCRRPHRRGRGEQTEERYANQAHHP